MILIEKNTRFYYCLPFFENYLGSVKSTYEHKIVFFLFLSTGPSKGDLFVFA